MERVADACMICGHSLGFRERKYEELPAIPLAENKEICASCYNRLSLDEYKSLFH